MKKENIKGFINYGCIGIAIFCCIFSRFCTLDRQKSYDSYTVYKYTSEMRYEAARLALIDSVDCYIKKVAPESCLDALVLVELCEKYDFDIKFALAQGHLESHFGTEGMAAKTHSVFNLYAYDGVKNPKGYKYPNESIEPYIRLIKNKYLGDTKMEYDLFENFVTLKEGNRYASEPTYEQRLFSIYNKIDNVCNVGAAIVHYNKYKVLANK